jgi:hypothetical protein
MVLLGLYTYLVQPPSDVRIDLIDRFFLGRQLKQFCDMNVVGIHDALYVQPVVFLPDRIRLFRSERSDCLLKMITRWSIVLSCRQARFTREADAEVSLFGSGILSFSLNLTRINENLGGVGSDLMIK